MSTEAKYGIAELRALLTSAPVDPLDASPLPWRQDEGTYVLDAQGCSVLLEVGSGDAGECACAETAALIVAAVNSLPELLDEIERLTPLAEAWEGHGSLALERARRIAGRSPAGDRQKVCRATARRGFLPALKDGVSAPETR